MKTSFLELGELTKLMRGFFPEHLVPSDKQWQEGFNDRYNGFGDSQFTSFSVNGSSLFWHLWLKPSRTSEPFFMFNKAEEKEGDNHIPLNLIDVEISDPTDKTKEEWVSLQDIANDDEDIPPHAFKWNDDTCHFRCLLFINQIN